MRRRILLAFLAFILGPTLIALTVTQRITHSLFEERVLRYSAQLTNQVARAIDAHLVNYRNLTLQLYFNDALLDAIIETRPEDWAEADIIPRVLAGYVNSDRYISTAYMVEYEASGEYLMEDAIVQGMPYLDTGSILSAYQDRIAESSGRLVWLPTQRLQSVFGRRYNTFIAVRPVRNANEIVALLILLFREDFFRERYREVVLESEENNYLVTTNGTVVSSGGGRTIGSRISEEIVAKMGDRSSGWFLVDSPTEYYIAYARSHVTDWAFVSEISRAALLADLVPVRNVVVVISILLVFFMVWLGSNVSQRITSPLREVQEGIHQIGAGDLSVRLPVTESDLGDLAETVNRMVTQLSSLLEKVASEERERQQDRLRFLQMQLSPHFVYNSLNTIRWMAIINHQDNIKTMIDSLIQLMKNVARPDSEHTTLGQELKLLRHYAYIQQMRFPNFSLRITVPDELAGAKINKFVLQNLVENSIVHGFADRTTSGTISIAAWAEKSDLIVEVADDGAGFDPSESMHRPSDEEHNHTWLARIQERITLVHGAPYGLTIDSEEGRGTRVHIRVPYRLAQDSDAA